MRTIRVHVDMPLEAGTRVDLAGGGAEHVLRVLRLGTGDPLTLFDGHDYAGVIETTDRRRASVRIDTRQAAVAESPLRLTLAQALARGDKMDWIVQKATELGVHRIVPLATERSEVRLDASRARKRLAHWRAVASAACEQCGRAVLPHIEAPVALPAWLAAQAENDTLRLALLPGDGMRTRELDLDGRMTASLAVGPEGGWGERDLMALREAHFTALRLGPRVLRTETAGVAGLAALQAVHGDL
jgi:16S rRNA (uracil1498-N3)-methyltransferase